jgi:transposase-like protein
MAEIQSESNKFKRYRRRLKERGLRQVQLWVPDTARAGFGRKLARQLREAESGQDDADSLDFIEGVADWND